MASQHSVLFFYHRDHTARSDAVTHAKHRHVISIVSPLKEILISHIIGMVVHHEAATFHSARVTVTQVGRHVSTVTHALIRATLEVPVLVEDSLTRFNMRLLAIFGMHFSKCCNILE